MFLLKIYYSGILTRRLAKMADEEERALEAAGKDENGDSIFGLLNL